MIAAFHSTGATYERKNRRWLFSTPRHQALSDQQAAAGEHDADEANAHLALDAGVPGGEQLDDQRRGEHAEQHRDRHRQEQQRRDRACHAACLVVALLLQQLHVGGDERGRQDALAEQVLQEIGQLEGVGEGVGCVGVAEVVGHRAGADEPCDARKEDAGRHHQRATPPCGARAWPVSRHGRHRRRHVFVFPR